MNTSILTSIKKMLGIAEDYTHFDMDIIMHINSVLMILQQIGIGPVEGYSISDSTPTWNDFVPEEKHLEAIKTYMYLKVKLLFDPPLGSAVTESINRLIAELEWRLYVAAESKQNDSEEVIQNG